MNVGATEQEVLESKKLDLTKRDRDYSSRRENNRARENNKTIYYYQSGHRTPDDNIYPKEIYVPIENYSEALIGQLDMYLGKIYREFDFDRVDVLVTLRSVIFPNDKELQLLRPTKSRAVWEIVQRYTRCIMQLVGSLAECVLVDNCANNSEINRMCMNIALFKDEILETYDIPYDDYVAYSTSFSYMFFKDPRDGVYKARENRYYNPHHTSMDIGWCKKDNIWDQLRTEMREIRYIDNAKMQVKATLDCDNLDLDSYLLTPVIVFDFDHGIKKLIERYPHHLIYSAYDLFPGMALQLEKYFQIVASYVCGFTNKLNISETDLKKDERLQTLFSTSVHELTTKKRILDKEGLIKLAEDAGKPVRIMA